MAEEKGSLDILGVKPLGETVKVVAEVTLEGIGAFLGRICLPAAEEFGMLLRDRVSAWRTKNLEQIVARAEEILRDRPEQGHAHPRLIALAVEQGSWAGDEKLHTMWGGLLASSCTADGSDDSNLLFMNQVAQLSASQAKILTAVCHEAPKHVARGGWVYASEIQMPLQRLMDVSGLADFHRIDRELDHLRGLELLLESGFPEDSTVARLIPSTVALHLFARCQGYSGSPVDFYANEVVPDEKVVARLQREAGESPPISAAAADATRATGSADSE